MKYNVQLSPEAIDDLKEIKQYIAEDLANEKAAEKTVKKIFDKIRKLSHAPRMGTNLSKIIGVDTDYRFLVCANYLAFYRIEESTVHVSRVIYGRRDYMRILFDKNKNKFNISVIERWRFFVA